MTINFYKTRCLAVCVASAVALLLFSTQATAAPVCDDDGGAYVCVDKSGDAPLEGTDFTFDFTDADNPDVVFLTGDLAWKVWSQVSSSDTTPANLGDLTLDPTVSGNDFELTIQNGTTSGPGAVDVKSIVLNDAGFTGYSLIEGGSISGDLTSDLTLIKDSGGSGGSASDFTIQGDAKGDIFLPRGAGFSIKGAYAPATISKKIDVGDITNGTLLIGSVAAARIDVDDFSNGILQINGDIAGVGAAPQCTFYISSMASNSSLRGAYELTAGSETIEAAVILSGDLASGCTIDFSNAKLANASISIGPLGQYDLVGDLLVYEWLSSSVFLGDDISGDVTITSDFAPQSFLLKGDLSSGGTIDIGGDFTSGTLDVEGDIAGDVQILGDMDGNVTTDGKLASTGRILVNGLGTGDVSIGTETVSGSLIRMLDGLSSTGQVTVNASGGAFDANGQMHFGPVGGPIGGGSLGLVTFDGLVLIDGDMTSGIGVNGCHATTDSLDIWVCGTVTGRIKVTQTGCSTQIPSPYYACPSGTCP